MSKFYTVRVTTNSFAAQLNDLQKEYGDLWEIVFINRIDDGYILDVTYAVLDGTFLKFEDDEDIDFDVVDGTGKVVAGLHSGEQWQDDTPPVT